MARATPKGRLFFIAVVLFFVAVGSRGGWAVAGADDALQVSADEFSLWDGSRLFVAQGNVTVRFKGALITADVLQYDAEAGYAVFTGNVFYADDEQELAGRTLHYDLEAGAAVFDDIEAVFYSEGVKGPMFVTGQRVRAEEGEVRMERATFTTCECTGDTPAYRFVAKELEIYPNDRVIARGVTFYDHKVPLLYLPYLTLSLKENTSRFDMPQIGYSERTGWYVKLTYNYVLKSGLYGALLFDYFQKLGVGGGVRHTYVDDGTGVGTVYIYGVGNEWGGADGSFAWERRWEGRPWHVATRYRYDVTAGAAGIESESLKAQLEVEKQDQGGHTSFNADYEIGDRWSWSEPDTKLSAGGSVRRRLATGWELRIQGEAFDQRRNGQRRRWLGYAGELIHTAPKYTLTTRVEQQVNPDLKQSTGASRQGWTHVSRLPEVTLALRRMGPLDLRFGAARLKEEPSGDEAWRGEAEVALVTQTWRVTPALSVYASGSLRGRTYTTGDTNGLLQGRTGLNVQLARPLSATVQYTYRDGWGGTPFAFDRVTPAETIAPRLNWRSGALTASLSTTYNVRTALWSTLAANATWRVAPGLVVRGSGTYNFYQRTVERVAATMDWSVGDTSVIRLGGVYDFRNTSWKTVHTDMRLAVGGGWEAGVTAIYDFAKRSFSRNHAYISHTACGCREIRLRWDHVQGEVWLEYHITAFPSSRVALGAGDDKLMFESDALTDFLKD